MDEKGLKLNESGGLMTVKQIVDYLWLCLFSYTFSIQDIQEYINRNHVEVINNGKV